MQIYVLDYQRTRFFTLIIFRIIIEIMVMEYYSLAHRGAIVLHMEQPCVVFSDAKIGQKELFLIIVLDYPGFPH